MQHRATKAASSGSKEHEEELKVLIQPPTHPDPTEHPRQAQSTKPTGPSAAP